MLRLTVVTLFTFMTAAHAELKVLPFHQEDLDNVTLGIFTSQLTKGALIPPSHIVTPLNRLSPMNLRMPQGRPDFSQGMRAWLASPYTGAQMTSVSATAGAPRVVAAAATTNVFGEQLQGCKAEGDLCEYTGDQPKICVRTGKFTMRFSCKSIWEANWKPFRKSGGEEVPAGEQKPAAGDTTKCEAISSEVLDSQYSKDVYDNFWSSVTVGKVKDVARPGMGPNDAATQIVQEAQPKKNAKSRRFRKSIDFICRTCALYAEDFGPDAKSTLDSKCRAMGWSENALDEPPPLAISEGRGAVETGKEDDKPAEVEEEEAPAQELAQTSPSIIGIPALEFAGGVFVGSGVTFMLVSLRKALKRTSTIDGSLFQPLSA